MAAKVYITEYQDIGAFGQEGYRHFVPIADASVTVTENANSPITASGSTGASAAFAATTNFIRVKTDSGGAINFNIGTAATAATTNAHMSQDSTEYFKVKAGDVISVITSAA